MQVKISYQDQIIIISDAEFNLVKIEILDDNGITIPEHGYKESSRQFIYDFYQKVLKFIEDLKNQRRDSKDSQSGV